MLNNCTKDSRVREPNLKSVVFGSEVSNEIKHYEHKSICMILTLCNSMIMSIKKPLAKLIYTAYHTKIQISSMVDSLKKRCTDSRDDHVCYLNKNFSRIRNAKLQCV